MVRIYAINPRAESSTSAAEFLGPMLKITRVNLRSDDANGLTNISSIASGLLPTPPASCQNQKIKKYWKQRYELFSRYDDGVRMDTEGWFSVTPETIAKHHAARCGGGGTIVDCFAGVGGNVIQFAKRSKRVIAVDIDPVKLQCTKHNAAIYGIPGRRIEYVLGDSTVLAPELKGDVVFLSPPWGGPDYSKSEIFDMNTMLKPIDGQSLFNIAKKIAPMVVMFLPRNVDVNQLAEIAISGGPAWSLEVEKNYLNGKFKTVTTYFTQTKW